VARLRAQGAVILGKTTVSEFTMGPGQVTTSLFGTTRNPWNTELTTGSSSGGAAAAVATGMGPVALATDGGGSIRRPAGFNALVGLKPGRGRVARENGLPVILDGVEVIGPITRTMDDCAMTLRAIQGPSSGDPASQSFASSDEMPLGKPLRILYVPSVDGYVVDSEIAASCAAAARALASLGHLAEEGRMPVEVDRYLEAWPVITDSGLAWLVRDRAWEGQVGAVYEAMIRRGRQYGAVDYLAARATFEAIRLQFEVFFETYDLLMTPASGAMPWAADQPGPRHHRVFTGIANAAGLPGISLPADSSPAGLPIGFQLVGPMGSEWQLIAIARQYERAHPWKDRWPQLVQHASRERLRV
jgi:aspartyl-tRNA(Asn)/glutamyl-tRNA(Gln) amidotransferase subunit A